MVGTKSSPMPSVVKSMPNVLTKPSKKEEPIFKTMPDIPTKPSPRPKSKAQSSGANIDDDSNSAEIDKRVNQAAKNFEVLQGNIQNLIEALESQHLIIKTLDKRRLNTAKQLEVLVADTPLAPVVASSKPNSEDHASDGEDAKSTTTYNSVISAVKTTYLELCKNHYDLVVAQAKSFDTKVIQYAEEWLEVTSARISSNLMEFKNLCENLEHYSTKVDKLKKSQERPKALRMTNKLERNETKLRGARESHDNMGENLYKLMEETTVRAWKDLLPLLMQAIKLDLTQASEERRVVWDDMQVVLEALEAISAQHNVSPDGRLSRIKKDHIDALYTGTESSHHTAIKPIEVSSASKPTTIKVEIVNPEETGTRLATGSASD